jgi:hypothetical protein
MQQIAIDESHVTIQDNVNSSLAGIQLGLMEFIRSRSILVSQHRSGSLTTYVC